MWGALTRSGLLPDRLAKQLGDYLPSDTRELVRAPGDPSGPSSGPRLLHGDLSTFNILLEQLSAEEGVPCQWMPCAILDLGDAGHGDPLYDIVTAHLALFRSALASCARHIRGGGAEEESHVVLIPIWAVLRSGATRSF